MEKVYNKITGSKLYLLLALGWLALGTSSCTFFYYTPDGGSFTGTTTYCEGATATPNTLNYSECSSGTGFTSSGVACTVQWYYNTTGGTVIGSSTALGAPTAFTSSNTGAGTLNYTPRTVTPGTFYYFAYITWGTGYCTSPFTSGTQTVTINPPPGPITGPTSVCIGSHDTLHVPVTGGTWSSSATGVATVAAGVVTGVTPGTAVITYISTGCGAGAAVTINVLSATPPIAGSTSVCQGASTTLSDAASPGTWSSGTPSVASIDPSSGAVAGLSQGMANITYTVGSGCTAVTSVFVNNAPGPVAGPGSVCQGSYITVTDPATGGTWSSSSTGVATVTPTSGIVTGASPGTAVITYSNGCGAPATTTITVNSLPAAITGTPGVCIGAATALADATLFGTWSSAFPAIATVSSSGVATGVSAGMATISYNGPNGCAATIAVTVLPPLAPITGAPTVCQGLTTALGASPAGGTWQSGNTAIATIGAASGIVSGITMGTSVITYTAGVGCSAVRTMTVNPFAPVVGRDSVCLGLSTFLTDIVGGGRWSASGPAVTVDPDSGRVTGRTPGSVVITYLLPTGCQSSVNFSVISFPVAITGTGKACPGTTTTLADVTAGGLWSSSDNSVATVGAVTGVVTGVSPDSVNIAYSILPGCAVQMGVAINPLPALITGGGILCPGTIDTLKDITPGGLWSSGTPSLATVIDTSGIVTAAIGSGGHAVIEYTLPTGCLRTQSVSVNPAPVPVINYANGTFSTPDIYVSYQWYDSIQGEIAGAVSYNMAALYNEYYYVVVTDTNGCQGKSALYHFDPGTAGIKGAGSNSPVSIYPNPTSGILYIEAQVRVRAVVNGIDGKKELEQPDAKQIDISRLASGMYFITLYNDDNEALTIQKFVKE